MGPAGGLSVVRSLQARLPVCQQGRQGRLPQASGFLRSILPPLPFRLSSFKNFPFAHPFLILICMYGGTNLTHSLCDQFSLEEGGKNVKVE